MRRGEPRPAGRDGVAVTIGAVEPGQRVHVTLEGDLRASGNDVPARVFELLDRAQLAFDLKRRVHDAMTRAGDCGDARAGLLELAALDAPEELRAALTEIVLAHS